MSESRSQALAAIAFQLAATLHAYEETAGHLVAAPLDLDLYQRVLRQMHEMRMYSASLPSVGVAWVELMIRHSELTQGIWRAQQEGVQAAGLQQVHAQLREAVAHLAGQCRQLMPGA